MLIVFDSICTVFGSVTILVVDYQYRFVAGMVTNGYENCLPAAGRLQFIAEACFGGYGFVKSYFYYSKYTKKTRIDAIEKGNPCGLPFVLVVLFIG